MNDDPVAVDHAVQRRYPSQARFCPLCAGAMRLRRVLSENQRFNVCSACGYVDFRGPKLVAGCLPVSEGRLLLLRRAIEPQRGRWTFPGGYVNLGELPQEAALRETREEVGLEAHIERLLGVYADPEAAAVVVIAYLASVDGASPVLSAEALEARFFAPEEIPWDETAFATTRSALREWLSLA